MADKQRRERVHKNRFTTKSGNTIKVNRSLSDKFKSRKDGKTRRKAERLSALPKARIKRMLYRLQPKRLYHYWFSRDGGIMALKILGIGLILGFIFVAGVFAYFRKDLPNLKDISGTNIGGSIRYYDKSGQTLLWEDYDAAKRIPVKDEEMSIYIKQATVAIEDKEFFKHGGFDTRGIIRAGFNNAFSKSGSTQGGSTITQQLVKLTQNWARDRTVTRKIKELILSVELERTYSKKEILNGYLNVAPYGGIEYGVEAAAQDYFNKSAKDLTLAESAMLAAIPQSPRYYSPYSPDFDKPAFTGRQFYILDQMRDQGMITKEQNEEAKTVNVLATVKPRKPKYENIKSPWFVLAAKEQLEDQFGAKTVKRGGWKVITTLDSNLQQIAEEQVAKGLPQIKRQGGDTAGFVAEDVETGQVVALVGGTDFNNPEFGQNNYGRIRLPPGSSFKPYDYAALIEHTDKFGAGSVLYDTKGPMDGYPCTNQARPKQGGNCLYDYDFRFPGPLTLRYSLGGSRNVPAVKAMLIAGVDKTIETAEKLGLSSGYNCYEDEEYTVETQCYASSAIGDGAYLKLDEHIHAYGSLSRNGKNIPKTYLLKIEDAAGKTVDEWKLEKGEQAIREDTAYIVADMMEDPRASYFSKKPHRYKDWKFALKTGTTNDTKDGLLLGFSSKYSAGVWVGYHTRRKEMSGFMENMTLPIWQGWMNQVHENLPAKERPKPAGVQTLPAYIVRTHVGVGSQEPSPAQDLFPSWYKSPGRKTGAKRTIDIISNKLATDCTPARAKKEISDADAESFSGDSIRSGSNTDEKDDVHKCSDARPSIKLNVTALGNGAYNVSATVGQGTHPMSSNDHKGQVNFLIDGQVISSTEIGGSGSTPVFNYVATFTGSKSITAEVVDSVLYDGSDSTTIVGKDFTISITGATTSTVSWNSSFPSGTNFRICVGGEPNCKNNTGNSVNITSLSPTAGQSVTVSSGGVTAPATISGP